MTRQPTSGFCNAGLRFFPRLLLLALLPTVTTPALSGSSFKSGNFGKTMTDAPVTQVVTHNLGEVPKALIIWTPRGTTIHYNLGIGFSDGTTQRSVSAASRNQRSFSETNSRQANKVLTIVEYDGTVLAEADLIAWDSTTFTLNWTTNHGSTYGVHFMVIGGSDVSAKVLDWTLPAGGGLTPVTGTGFEPDAVFHLFSGYSVATPHGLLGTGAMDADGGQWANSFLSLDGMADTDTQRGQSTSACIYAVDSDLTVLREASFVSMDADGFTVGFSAGPGWSGSAVSLALSGLNAKAGSFAKSPGFSQSINGVGFQPSLVILSSFQQVAQFSPVPHARFGFGAGDGTTEGSSSLTDTDLLPQTDVGTRGSSSKIFLKTDMVDGFTEAAADLSSLDADGFTLDWTTNDAAATEILYLALGSLPGNSVPKLVKRVFETDGTPIASGATVPSGATVKFLAYLDNPGAALTDLSVQDVLDAAFEYQPGSIRVDDTLQSSVVCPGGVCDESAIFASVDGQDASTDAVDGDVVSFTGVTLDVGNQNTANAQLDIAAGTIWALVFTVRVQ